MDQGETAMRIKRVLKLTLVAAVIGLLGYGGVLAKRSIVGLINKVEQVISTGNAVLDRQQAAERMAASIADAVRERDMARLAGLGSTGFKSRGAADHAEVLRQIGYGKLHKVVMDPRSAPPLNVDAAFDPKSPVPNDLFSLLLTVYTGAVFEGRATDASNTVTVFTIVLVFEDDTWKLHDLRIGMADRPV